VLKKSVYNASGNKIMRTNNAFSTNILMFCDKKSENEILKLSHFERSKNIKNLSTFLFLNAYFNA